MDLHLAKVEHTSKDCAPQWVPIEPFFCDYRNYLADMYYAFMDDEDELMDDEKYDHGLEFEAGSEKPSARGQLAPQSTISLGT